MDGKPLAPAQPPNGGQYGGSSSSSSADIFVRCGSKERSESKEGDGDESCIDVDRSRSNESGKSPFHSIETSSSKDRYDELQGRNASKKGGSKEVATCLLDGGGKGGQSVMCQVQRTLGRMTGTQADGEHKKEQHKGMGGGNMFADADALRADIHDNIAKKDYDVADYYYETGCIATIAKSGKFSSTTLLVITINACWIGFDAECNDARAELPIPRCPAQPTDLWVWMAGDQFFCAFFTWELLIRFFAFKATLSALRDHWFKFDSMLVFFMVAETWIMPLALGDSDGLSNMSMLRMLRLLRLSRLVRLMRSVPELVTLMKGMAIAAKSVGYTLLLLFIFMYIFSIIFVQQLESTEVEVLQDTFSGIFQTMWTLLLAGCLLDDSTMIADKLLEEGFAMAALFMVFVLVASLMILNMLIGVLCAVVTAVAACEKEKILVSYVKSKLMDVLNTLDEDGNGTISKVEFDKLMSIPQATEALDDLGVDVPNLISLADHLFAPEEDDENPLTKGKAMVKKKESTAVLEDAEVEAEESEEVAMSFADFLEMVIRLRADNCPSVADIVELRKLVFKGQRGVARRLNQLEKGQLEIQRGIRMASEQLDSALTLWEEMSITMDTHGKT